MGKGMIMDKLKMKTPDLIGKDIASFFPSCITESKGKVMEHKNIQTEAIP